MAADEKIQLLIDKRKIASGIKRLAAEISADYKDESPVLLAVLKGSFIFLSDLVRRIDIHLEVEFIRLSSYDEMQSTGRVNLAQELLFDIENRHVLIVEDIVDTGRTACFLLDYLKEKGPASIRLCTLLDKPCCRQLPVRIDYTGFTIPDDFIVGYGLDYNEKYRNLADIYILNRK